MFVLLFTFRAKSNLSYAVSCEVRVKFHFPPYRSALDLTPLMEEIIPSLLLSGLSFVIGQVSI